MSGHRHAEDNLNGFLSALTKRLVNSSTAHVPSLPHAVKCSRKCKSSLIGRQPTAPTVWCCLHPCGGIQLHTLSDTHRHRGSGAPQWAAMRPNFLAIVLFLHLMIKQAFFHVLICRQLLFNFPLQVSSYL